ncbi:MAG: hypothetical protein WAM30_07730 [Candidatus Dormiibacterota bacterium]
MTASEAAEPAEPHALPARGRCKIYLGGAPGSGKTFAMLQEGNRLLEQGVDVVAAFVETYDRPRTIQAIGRLPLIPRRRLPYRGTVQEEMDLEAVLRRRPQVALVDELAHTNVPGVPPGVSNEKRWQDVAALQEAGIDVIATVNIQHVERVKDLVERITGVVVRETIPDRVLDEADELQFIDITPEALRKRMRHGNVYPPERVEPALASFFRATNLTALREIGLRLVADSMATRSGVVQPGEDVLVVLLDEDENERLLRRGARLARHLRGLCMVVAVAPPDGDGAWVQRATAVGRQLGSSFSVLRASDPATAAIEAVRASGARHVLLDASGREGGGLLGGRSVAWRLMDAVPEVDLVLAGRPPASVQPAKEDDDRPPAEELVRRFELRRRRSASFRIHLAYATGCGATLHMLDEARRRQSRGTDVVVAAVRSLRRCDDAVDGLELLGGPNGPAAHDRLDVDALLARNPEVCCIDDLAGLDTEGRPRVESVRRLRRAGMTVLATLHLLDVRSQRQAYAEVSPRSGPIIDDEILARADEIELVDVPPQELVTRLRRGELLPPAEIARALQREFRLDVLDSLRESALRLLADHTDARLMRDMRRQRVRTPWEARTRIVLCVQPEPHLEPRIRAVAAMASVRDARLTVLSVRPVRLREEAKRLLGDYAALTHRLGGEFVTRHGSDPPDAIVAYVRATPTTEVVVGRPSRRRLPWHDVVLQLMRRLPGVDLHIRRREVG